MLAPYMQVNINPQYKTKIAFMNLQIGLFAQEDWCRNKNNNLDYNKYFCSLSSCISNTSYNDYSKEFVPSVYSSYIYNTKNFSMGFSANAKFYDTKNIFTLKENLNIHKNVFYTINVKETFTQNKEKDLDVKLATGFSFRYKTHFININGSFYAQFEF